MIQITLNMTIGNHQEEKTRKPLRARKKRARVDRMAGHPELDFSGTAGQEGPDQIPGEKERLGRIVNTIASRTDRKHRDVWSDLYAEAARISVPDLMVRGHRARSKTHLEMATAVEIETLIDIAIGMLEQTIQKP